MSRSQDRNQDGPRLPPELEREIFTLSLKLQVQNGRNLMLVRVAKRVFDWLIPVYYSVVIGGLDWPPKCSAALLRRYGHHVRHFHIQNRSLIDLLQYCPNVSNLGIWILSLDPEAEAEAIVNLPVTRLSIGIQCIFEKTPKFLAFCSNITHLEISTREPWEPAEILPHFPVLTRLAIFADFTTELTQECLTVGKMLKVIILISSQTNQSGQLHVLKNELEDDIRVVRLLFGRSFVEDWAEGAWGRRDMWMRSDEMVERRIERSLEL
ncbi:hypothetical protein BDN72DRAFT_834199 [Pluteus cervinus]|uniref:Uncharacterized protein n=1 Tax=Pluteus cervinus TaxID=181527 RepID=A0ACD3B7S1_9AGAR|nr:hypothetical protein BDN72DRAFT_834199 [Pluteus cervinus]